MKICMVTQQTMRDVVPLFNAYREFYGQSSDLQQAEQFIQERVMGAESIIFLAYLEEEPVGFAQLFPVFSSVAMKRAFLLNDLFVAKQARKQGVAQALMEQCYIYCQQEDARYMMLETARDNVQAQKLYEKMGMTIDETVYYYSIYW
ncbi:MULTISPECIES: GNAT family N-acetyltransferase [Lysinibacillus]|uniref:GNAT family N-acetyltransferase n=1 Tax=Lysinibacillus capsici TaxID=2115968 RepID=A0ABY8KH28_9BACI|nr:MULTISPECIES: GNAT family N-acetyltransferase [Lysinibacillus]MCT1539088.1 GNAT family N-acetyltransferase [Lysinibacillus capsici]MCT1569695.1 GNAT family N-acetyltransferase [Lysinibacillus capsici]MCT1647153.1 GNAT family N-acetyltransferase [Lysinibacillus capsici]MCT1725694.1 GNAT family N-acetyltransferase [Lysinibacillus capsici]MCT1782899.1 GNAT family N-acetyltransferase [Lysinibacillus capsici]